MTEIIGLSALAAMGLLLAFDVSLPLPEGFYGRAHLLVRRPQTGVGSGPDPSAHRWWSRWARGIVVAGVVAFVTGGPVVTAAAALVAFHLDRLRGLWTRSLAPIERGDACAGWAEMLADTLEGGRGLEQAVVSTGRRVRPVIRAEVQAFLARLEDRPLSEALVGLDDALDHPGGDLLVGALQLAAAGDARYVSRTLRLVSGRVRSLSEALATIDGKRAQQRRGSRTLLWTFALVGAFFMAVLAPFIGWYRTSGGQVLLTLVVLTAAVLLLRLRRLAQLPMPERVFVSGCPGESS